MKINYILEENNINAILIKNMNNVFYLSKFDGTMATLVILKDKKYILVDSRYYEQALKQTNDFIVILIDKVNYYFQLNKIITENNINELGFEDDLIFKDYQDLKDKLNINLKSISLAKLREIKSDIEIEIIKKACEITDLAFKHLLDYIRVGQSEKDINIELQKFILDHQATGLSFKTIVASGLRSSLPHGCASEKIIEENDIITLDFGIVYQGYSSDITRTIFVGSKVNNEFKNIYEIVKSAQSKAISAIKPGVYANEIDAIARDYIKKAGYGEYFSHGLGHGFGLEIHEEPYLNPSSQTILKANHIVTVEPGIYIPNFGGVRIEDDILVTNDGCEILTKSSRDLIIIKGEKQ